MPNLANTLKQEIARIARKELSGELASLRKAVTARRTDLARMKRENVALEQEVRHLRRDVSLAFAGADRARRRARVPVPLSAERLSAARAKLELSAADFGRLVGASGLSVYKWERGTKPRAKFMPALAAALRMGKREASAQLLKLTQSHR